MAKRVFLRRSRTSPISQQDASEAIANPHGEGVCALDDHGRIIAANSAAAAMLGYEPDELLGREASADLLPSPGNRPPIRRGPGSVATTSKDQYFFRRKDGSLLSVSCTVLPLSGGAGASGTVLVFRDVTEEQRRLGLLEGQQQALELLARGKPLAEVLTCLAHVIEDCFPNMICSVMIADAEQKRLRLGAAPSLPEGFLGTTADLLIGPAAGSCGTAAYRRELVVVEDVLVDPLWHSIGRHAAAHGLRACSSQPIISADGRVLGTFAMYYRQPWRPADAELDLIGQCAHLAGLAIERSQTDALLRQANTELESKVRERTIFLNTLLDSLEEGIAACDENGDLTLINAATQRLHGYPEQALPAGQWAVPSHLYDAHGRPIAQQETPLLRALAGEAIEGVEVVVADPARTRRVLSVTGRAMYDDAGRKLGAVVAMHDVTARKAAEAERLRLVQAQIARAEAEAAQAKVSDILESITDAFISVDRHCRLTYLNSEAERIAGASADRLLGKTIWEIYSDGLETPLFVALEQAVRDRVPVALEHHDVPKSRWYAVHAYPAKGGGVSVYFRDVSVRKQIESELQEAVRARDVFLSVCSHELKTPLTSLSLHAQMAQRRLRREGVEALTDNEVISLVNGFEKQTQRLGRLVDDMLDMSRINAGKLGLHLEMVGLGELVQEVMTSFAPQIEASGSSLRLCLGEDVCGRWDRYRLEQVLINLLTNALRYGGGRLIEVTTGITGGSAIMTVRDQGIGVAEEDQERIFQRFERAGSANEARGLGLGLYIVKQILAAHGGQIRVESSLGEGACFIVELPLQFQS